jgi:simple sugar transport system ATP-binding protein
MPATAPFLRLAGVSKRFGGVVALDGIDWEVEAGEVHCLVGENGCGKSTLIKIVAGVHPPEPGSVVEIGGASVLPLSPARAHALGIQVIFQDLSLFPNLTVDENIAVDQTLGGLMRPVDNALMRGIASEVLARLDHHLPLAARVGDLSVAERQIVAICRGLAGAAQLLFMDEPTASLTRAEARRLFTIVARLRAAGIAVVFVSHRLNEIVEIAERVTVLRDGRKVGTWPAAEVDQRRIASLMTGQEIEHRVVARDTTAAPPLLVVRGLSRTGEYDDVTFTLRRGEALGLTGLLGAGRTELALSLFGMARPDAGTIELDGQTLQLRSNQDAIRAGIAYVSEDRLHLGLILRQSIENNIVLPVLRRLRDAFGLVSPARRRREAARWVERLAIKAGRLDQPVQTLSGGNQQRVVLAKWLATAPRVLILDGPTIGVDVRNKVGIYRIVRELAEAGVGILLITDEIMEAFATCDRVLHMRAGRIVEAAVPGPVSEAELEARVYA